MTFEEYLVSKKIDSTLFSQNEKALWQKWKIEFEQIHPTSFTAQKLYLINPIRRKYPLKESATPAEAKKETEKSAPQAAPASAKPVMKTAKPVFKPKPK